MQEKNAKKNQEMDNSNEMLKRDARVEDIRQWKEMQIS